jgi:deoxyribodipyrimidine photo-lyase
LPNSPAVRQSKIFGPLFDTPIPEELTGFELSDSSGDKERMRVVWPAGEDVAKEVMVTLSHDSCFSSAELDIESLPDYKSTHYANELC